MSRQAMDEVSSQDKQRALDMVLHPEDYKTHPEDYKNYTETDWDAILNGRLPERMQKPSSQQKTSEPPESSSSSTTPSSTAKN